MKTVDQTNNYSRLRSLMVHHSWKYQTGIGGPVPGSRVRRAQWRPNVKDLPSKPQISIFTLESLDILVQHILNALPEYNVAILIIHFCADETRFELEHFHETLEAASICETPWFTWNIVEPYSQSQVHGRMYLGRAVNQGDELPHVQYVRTDDSKILAQTEKPWYDKATPFTAFVQNVRTSSGKVKQHDVALCLLAEWIDLLIRDGLDDLCVELLDDNICILLQKCDADTEQDWYGLPDLEEREDYEISDDSQEYRFKQGQPPRDLVDADGDEIQLYKVKVVHGKQTGWIASLLRSWLCHPMEGLVCEYLVDNHGVDLRICAVDDYDFYRCNFLKLVFCDIGVRQKHSREPEWIPVAELNYAWSPEGGNLIPESLHVQKDWSRVFPEKVDALNLFHQARIYPRAS